MPDNQIYREYFRPAPVSEDIRAAFGALGEIVVSHLPEAGAAAQARRFRAKLKPGSDAADAFASWIRWASGPRSTVGVIALDWKAREEISWQAKLLAKAHGLSMSWEYDHETDTEWHGWQERDEMPVEAPLRSLGRALAPHGLVLYRFGVDDAMFAFAVRVERHVTVDASCEKLEIPVLRHV